MSALRLTLAEPSYMSGCVLCAGLAGEAPGVVDVLVETGPVVVIVTVLLPDVLRVYAVGQHDGMPVVGVVLHAAVYFQNGLSYSPDTSDMNSEELEEMF